MNAMSSTTAPYKEATRSLTSVLAPLEKRVLIWLAERMPRRVNSDHLTVLALMAMLGAGLSYWLATVHPVGVWLAVFFLALNWFGDSLDGTLARVRNCQRPRYGYYVDHVVDELGAAFLLGGLALSGLMSPVVAIGLLISYLMLCVEVFLAAHSLGTFRMSYFKVGPTELRILLAVGSIIALSRPMVTFFGYELRFMDVGGAIGAVGLFVTLVVSAVMNTRRLYAEEPVRGSGLHCGKVTPHGQGGVA